MTGRDSIAGFTYYSPMTIDHTQVPSTQTDFPVLVNFTDNRFKTTGNGGHVNDSNGYDIRPYANLSGTAITAYELDYYNGSTGQVVMWVKIGSVSSSSDTVFYMAYGNPSLNTDASSSTTWSNNFRGVWHLKDGSTLTLTDSSGGGFTLTNNNTVTAATGKIDGAAGFASASSQYLTNSSIGVGTAVTFSCWFKPTSFAQNFAGLMCMRGATGYALINIDTTGQISVEVMANSDVLRGSFATISSGAWHHIALTYSSSAGLYGYADATQSTNGAANGNLNTDPTTINIGRDSFGTRYSNGVIDEPRIANVARSADWITCEYNNQKDSQTFLTLGTEQ